MEIKNKETKSIVTEKNQGMLFFKKKKRLTGVNEELEMEKRTNKNNK
jgi:hypothetical protein